MKVTSSMAESPSIISGEEIKLVTVIERRHLFPLPPFD